MKTFSMTHVGQRRETNQDYMYTSETSVGRLPDLFLVADGMGGHAAGDYASRFTVEKIVEYVTESEESEGDTILLCSDGLTNMVDDTDIKRIVLGQRDIVEKTQRLIDAANENGGKDNITVVLIEPFSDETR